MKAVYFDEHGGPEVLKFGDLPDPTAGDGEVVADIHAASVNGADWKVRAGSYAPVKYFPYICGRDFSGVVTEAGPGADFVVGDEVFGVLPAGQEGTYCEKVATRASVLAKKPLDVAHVDIDALSLIGLTAVISIEETLKLQPGEKILIQGGAGGVAGLLGSKRRPAFAQVGRTLSRCCSYARGKCSGGDQIKTSVTFHC